jgi:AcrR family transcriptional regulator
MPTGVAICDPRGQLFEAAERILLRDGPTGLTSRSVTAEAGVAKGVLHRHFADFDDFLAELALSRVARIASQADGLRAVAGIATVAGNLAAALPSLFTPEILALIRLVIARDELRARLRAATGSRIPLVSESTAMVAGYLSAERDLGRIAPTADISMLAPTLIGAAHLLFADADGTDPDPAAIAGTVATVLAGAARLRFGQRFGSARSARPVGLAHDGPGVRHRAHVSELVGVDHRADRLDPLRFHRGTLPPASPTMCTSAARSSSSPSTSPSRKASKIGRPLRVLVGVGQQRLREPRPDVLLPPDAGRAQHVDRDPGHHGRQIRLGRGGLGRGRRVAQPGLLHRVLGLGHAAEDPVGDREQQRPQLLELLGPGQARPSLNPWRHDG